MKLKIQDHSTNKGFRIVDLNRRKAIREYCYNCSGYSRKERENCWNVDCQLYPYRTGKGNQDSKARNGAIRAHCRDNCMEGHPSLVTDCSSPDCALYAYRQKKLDKSVEIKAQSEVSILRPDTPAPRKIVPRIQSPASIEARQLTLF